MVDFPTVEVEAEAEVVPTSFCQLILEQSSMCPPVLRHRVRALRDWAEEDDEAKKCDRDTFSRSIRVRDPIVTGLISNHFGTPIQSLIL